VKYRKDRNLNIEDILPVCNLDYIYEKCSPLEVLKKIIKQPKLCPYRIYLEKTGLFYCKWEIENVFVDIKSKLDYKRR
jgi:hypothetical protein